MKLPVDKLDIRIALRDDDTFIARMNPPAKSKRLPNCEIVDVAAVPYDVKAYIEFIERMVHGQ